MPPNNRKPVIFLAFANETESQKIGGAPRYLASLQEEKRKIQDTLLEAQKDGNCELKMEAFTRVDDIFEVFQSPDYRDRIAIFHFGGHAGGNELLFEKAGGGNQEANAEGLAKFFGHQKGLELVFLNGCSTRKQVEGLFSANIPAVIATEQDINDSLATRFAVFFYGGLANGLALKKAFDQAMTQIETVPGKQDPEPESHRNIGNTNRSSGLPWRLHIKPGSESIENWSLPSAANDHLFGLPKLKKPNIFLDSPYPESDGFKEKDAVYFFGRDEEIRALYDLVTDENSTPVIVFYGQAWVGKSSVLAAGLTPRLNQNHKVLNCKLDKKKVLSTVFRDAFNANETTTILEAWKVLEKECAKPVTVIIDQFEEVFNRHSTAEKEDIGDFEGEIEDFLKDLSSVFKDASTPPLGRVILSIRKEYEADLRHLLKAMDLSGLYKEFFLQRLQNENIVEAIQGPAIQGPTKVDYLAKHYGLIIDPGLPELIAEDILEDPESPVALMLQLTLSEMWRLAKNEDKTKPKFTKDAYLSQKREGVHVEAFLSKKLEELKEWNKSIYESGLVHDLLFEHVSDLNTAKSLSHEQLVENYHDHEPDISELVEKCKEIGLLVDPRGDQDNRSNDTRLKHDAFAPAVRARFEKSDAPGQRARRILESRRGEQKVAATLGSADLRTVKRGKGGMRSQTPDEEKLIKVSDNARKLRNTVWTLLSVVAIIAVWFAVGFYNDRQNERFKHKVAEVRLANANEKTKEEKARVHAARVVSLAESQADPLLSSLLLLSLKGQPEPAHGVRVALKTVQKPIPRDIMREHTDSVTSVECNPIKGEVITASSDKTARVWKLGGRHKSIPLEAHDGGLEGAVFSQFGDRFVTWADKAVYIWDSSKPPSKTLVGCHAKDVYYVSLRPDGQHLLTATSDKIRVWDVYNQAELDPTRIEDCNNDNETGGYYGKLIESLEVPEAEGFQASSVMTASYSPDGRYVVSALEDGRIIIWSVEGNQYLTPYTSTHLKGSVVLHAVFSNNNEDPADKSVYLATVDDSNENVPRLWKLEISKETGRVTGLSGDWKLEGHSEPVAAVRFSPDNSRILTISGDKTARLWRLDMKEDADNPFARVTLIGHSEAVSSGEFSPDGNHVVTGSGDDTLRVWNLGQIEDSKLQDSLEFTNYTDTGATDDVTDVVFCPDSNSVVSTSRDGQVRLWDINGPSEPLLLVKEKEDPALDARFSPDGSYLAAAFKNSPAKIWENDRQNNEFKFIRKLGTEPIRSIDFSPKFNGESDDTALKILTVRDVNVATPGSTPVQEWWLNEGPAKTLSSIDGKFSHALYHPTKARHVITTPKTKGDLARVWDGIGGSIPLYSHRKQGEEIKYAEISSDGSKVVTATGLNALLSNFMDQKCIEADEKCKKSEATCGNGKDDMCKAAQDACTEAVKTCAVEYKGQGNWLEMAVFSHDGQEVATASADGQVRVFRADSSKEYPPFFEPVKSIQFDPKNKRLLAASDTGEARIWNKDGSGEPIKLKIEPVPLKIDDATLKLDVKDIAMNSARFDPLAERVVTASEDGSVRIWRYQWDHLLEYLDSSTRVCLTVKQRMRFLTEEYQTACNEHRKCVYPDKKDQPGDEACVAEQ